MSRNSEGGGSRRLIWLADAVTPHTERWVRVLAGRGHRILLFSLTEPRPGTFEALPEVAIETMRMSPGLAYSAPGGLRKLSYLRAIPRISRLQRSFRADVCHAHYASSYGVLADLAGLRPLGVSIWGADVYTTPHRSPLHRFVISRVLRRADLVMSTSHVMREQGRALADVDIQVVPFGVDVSRFAPRDGLRPTRPEFVIGTVKSLETKYGIEHLLRATALLRDMSLPAPVRLRIAGSGSLRPALERLAVELGIEGQTEFLGAVRNQAVHEMHRDLDVAVYPSIDPSESFGVSAVESQACGIPVIVSRIGGLPEVVAENETGLIVPPGDPRALAQAIASLLCDAERRRRMGLAGRQRVLQRYDLERCADELQRHYDSLTRTG